MIRSARRIVIAVLMLVFTLPSHSAFAAQGGGGGGGGTQADIDALKAAVATLQSQVQALTTTSSSLLSQLQTAQGQISTLQSQVTTIQNNTALALGAYVSVDPNPINGLNGPHILFTGANVHIRSGSGFTDDNIFNGGSQTGLGNLVVGYDEVPPIPLYKRVSVAARTM